MNGPLHASGTRSPVLTEQKNRWALDPNLDAWWEMNHDSARLSIRSLITIASELSQLPHSYRMEPNFMTELKNKRPTRCHLLFYFTSYVLNVFRTLICPSSRACDCVDELCFSLQNENHQKRLSLSCHGLLMPVCWSCSEVSTCITEAIFTVNDADGGNDRQTI